jgi:dUTP pyrophosphatase
MSNAATAPSALRIRRLDDAAVLPRKAHPDDLGWDLAALETVRVEPGRIAKLRTGLAFGFPAGVGGFVKDRSSMAARGLHTLAGVIDPGYRGEVQVLVVNLGDAALDVTAGERIAQLVLLATLPAELVEVDDLDDTARGAGGFGSSGR